MHNHPFDPTDFQQFVPFPNVEPYVTSSTTTTNNLTTNGINGSSTTMVKQEPIEEDELPSPSSSVKSNNDLLPSNHQPLNNNSSTTRVSSLAFGTSVFPSHPFLPSNFKTTTTDSTSPVNKESSNQTPTSITNPTILNPHHPLIPPFFVGFPNNNGPQTTEAFYPQDISAWCYPPIYYNPAYANFPHPSAFPHPTTHITSLIPDNSSTKGSVNSPSSKLETSSTNTGLDNTTNSGPTNLLLNVPLPSSLTCSPTPIAASEGTIFVNPKQYHRILKRRVARAKLERQLKMSGQQKEKSYKYNSRHEWAKKRARGPGGRFLSKKEKEKLEQEERQKQLEEANNSSSNSIMNGNNTNNDSNSPTADKDVSNTKSSKKKRKENSKQQQNVAPISANLTSVAPLSIAHHPQLLPQPTLLQPPLLMMGHLPDLNVSSLPSEHEFNYNSFYFQHQ